MSYFANAVDSPTLSNNMTFNEKDEFLQAMSKKCTSCMILKIYVNGPVALQELYAKSVASHNDKLIRQEYIDAGFDLFVPTSFNCEEGTIVKIDFGIQCAAYMTSGHPTGYYLYPRSSLSKTSMRLANSVGIIDAGYRGNIIGMFDCNNRDYDINQFDRLVQICSPTLTPIYVELVSSVTELGAFAGEERGGNGFGSSGR